MSPESKNRKPEAGNGPQEEARPRNGDTRGSLPEILAYIQTTDLESVEIERDGEKICLRRSAETIPLKGEGAPAKDNEKGEEGPKLFSIRSPIVGRFYGSMTPDRPHLVMEGGKVTAGQKVAIVEAMKIKKEVFSAVTGKVVRIFVRDGDPVEYGQELFSVDPAQEENV